MWTYWRSIKRISLEELCRAGARISIYQVGKMISMEILENRLSFLEEISKQVEWDAGQEDGMGERNDVNASEMGLLEFLEYCENVDVSEMDMHEFAMFCKRYNER